MNLLSLDIYSYDGLGDRIRQVAPGGTISYTLDQAGGLTQVLAEITGTQTSTYVYGLTRTSQQTSAGTQYFLDDGLGSVRELVDASGNLTLVKRYDPYGQTISSSGSGGSNYGFAGEYKDPSALIFLRSRYYTSRGRFIQKDSIPGSYIKLADGGASYDGSGTSQANTGDWYVHYTRPQTLNGWSYANGNPTNHTDPSGHFVPFCMFGYYFDKQTNTCKPTAIAGLLNSFLPPGSATIAFESSSAPGPGEIIGPLVLGGVCVFAIGALIHTVIQTQFQSVTVLQAQTRQTSTGETVRVRELSDSEVRQRGLHREKDAQGYGATDKVYEDENGNTWIGNDQGELQPFP